MNSASSDCKKVTGLKNVTSQAFLFPQVLELVWRPMMHSTCVFQVLPASLFSWGTTCCWGNLHSPQSYTWKTTTGELPWTKLGLFLISLKIRKAEKLRIVYQRMCYHLHQRLRTKLGPNKNKRLWKAFCFVISAAVRHLFMVLGQIPYVILWSFWS